MTTLDIIYGDYKVTRQIFSDVIPQIGSKLGFSSSRNNDNNYARDGKATEYFRGIVDKIEYHYEESGTSHLNYNLHEYITVYVKPIQ